MKNKLEIFKFKELFNIYESNLFKWKKLKFFFEFQLKNSGEAKNNEIIKIKTIDEFKFVLKKKFETNLKNKLKYVEKFYHKY